MKDKCIFGVNSMLAFTLDPNWGLVGVVPIFNCASDQQVKEHRLNILIKQVHTCTDGRLKVTQNAQNTVLQGLKIQNWDVCLLKIPVKHVFH